MKWKKLLPLTLAAALTLGMALPAQAAQQYSDYDHITGHIRLHIPQTLTVSRPEKDLSTIAPNYYLTGTSDPSRPLTINGQTVENRGSRGSWGVYTALHPGENRFVLRQGNASVTRIIHQGEPSSPVPVTDRITKAFPPYDTIFRTGECLSFTCVAPAGAEVTLYLGDTAIDLRQNVAAAQAGVPATYSAKLWGGQVQGVHSLGKARYTLTWNGVTTTCESPGELFLCGPDDPMMVRVRDTAATVFYEENTDSDFMTTARRGALARVVETGPSMVRLDAGGWINRSAVEPYTGEPVLTASLGKVDFTAHPRYEQYRIHSDGAPLYAAYQSEDRLHLEFYNSTGLGSFPVEQSTLFSQAAVTEKNGRVILDLFQKEKELLWGYTVEYDGTDILLTCQYRPVLSRGSKPLTGMVIAVDPGHGGKDPGALGIPGTDGPMEKDVTLDTGIALQKRLESLGAQVVLLRSDDSFSDLNARMDLSNQARADLYLSLHCNSIGFAANGLRPRGVEVYYYEDIAEDLAGKLSASIAEATGRIDRGGKYSNYRVTLNSGAPAVLMELGFLTNPIEYDDLCTPATIYRTVNAIADAVLDFLA